MSEDWKLAVKWVDQCGCLSADLKNEFNKNTLSYKTFGIELRDGIILCNLLNYLRPNSIDSSKVSKHSTSSRVMSDYNISLFQEACKNFFDLESLVQIDSDKLYDLDLSQVLKVLSSLSVCPASIAKGKHFLL